MMSYINFCFFLDLLYSFDCGVYERFLDILVLLASKSQNLQASTHELFGSNQVTLMHLRMVYSDKYQTFKVMFSK